MPAPAVHLLVLLGLAGQTLDSGDSERSVKLGDAVRSYLVHVPPGLDRSRPAPVVLNFHGAWTNAKVQVVFSGLNGKADAAGFVAVYPNGTGARDMLFWNAGMVPFQTTEKRTDDVAFVAKILDDLGQVVRIDSKRVYATGMSNGGMMCYRLAAELSDRIAAIAPVSGTMAIDKAEPKRPVPVLHFHGTADAIVPFGGPNGRLPRFLRFKPVEETIKLWADLDGCPERPVVERLPESVKDGTSVSRETYGPGRQGSEVVLLRIEGAGHTWPGDQPPVKFLGKSTSQISANDLIWEFFQKHPMP